MGDFIPAETVPQLSRKRPRLDDQIDEYRKNAAKRHAGMFANTLANSADAASAELGTLSRCGEQMRLQEDADMRQERSDYEQIQQEQLEVDERRMSYPGTLKPLRRADLGRVPEGSNYSRNDRRQTVQSTHANPMTGVENVRMTLQNRRR